MPSMLLCWSLASSSILCVSFSVIAFEEALRLCVSLSRTDNNTVIGISLVVAGDSVFGTLFAVIVFHQMFEGVALGSVIAQLKGTSYFKKSLMASAFALVTPIGMAIGVGVLEHFNGKDPSTLIALGTLNALSAGILVWVGVVEMWAKDWLAGPLAHAGWIKTGLSLFSLMLGMALMSLLGKWA